MNKVPPISDTTWDQLVVANRSAVQAGWAQKGVFATGIGNGYWENPKRLLYVGKSLGPLAHLVGMDYDRAKSAEASRKWMETQRNGGARFWQFVEQFDQNRQGLAWANISKIDRVSQPAIAGQRKKKKHLPPSRRQLKNVGAPWLKALAEELENLMPQVALFVTGRYCEDEVSGLLADLKYRPHALPFTDRWTTCMRSPIGTFVVKTRHPDWWNDEQEIQNVTNFVKDLLA